MIIIKPTEVTDSNFISSSISESEHAVWSDATTYEIGDRVILTTGYHSVYESVRATNLNKHPATDTSSPAYWVKIGPTNRWALFDTRNSTISIGTINITTTFSPGRIGGLYLSGLVGDQIVITLTDGLGGPTVYTKTISITKREVFDWYTYWYSDFEQISTVTVTDIPPYTNGVLSVSINGSGIVEIGTLLVGKILEEGHVQYGAEAGIIDYSRKETDSFGVTTFVERAFSKRFSIQLLVEKDRTLRLTDIFDSLRATPAVYIGSGETEYSMLLALGYYRSYRTVIQYPQHNLISIEIEGLA